MNRNLGIGPVGIPAQADALRRQLAANPADRISRHNLAVELRNLCRSEEALVEIERAWADGLHYAETAVMRGNLLADAGRFDEAIEAYREATRIKPELIEPHVVLASLLPQLGRKDEALDTFHEALRRVPENGPIWAQAMVIARGHGNYAQLLDWTAAAEARWGQDPLIETYQAIALSGLDRDVEALAVVDGLKGFPEAILAVFPEAVVQTCIVHLLRHSLDFVSWKDRKPVAAALKDIYRAIDPAVAETALAAFEAGPWGSKYAAIGQSWRRAWGHFPSDEAALKLLFLVLNRTEKEWTMPPRVWSIAKAQFAVMFGERFTRAMA